MKTPVFTLFTFILSLPLLWGTTMKGGKTVTINEPVSGDLYIAGENITINRMVSGDLISAGGEISIKDTVTEDVILAGGDLSLEGVVMDDARLAGGKIFIRNNIAGDLIIAGGEITVASGVVIGGNVYIAGGKVTLDGNINGILDIRGGEIEVNGTVVGETIIKGGEVYLNGTLQNTSELAAQEIIIGSNARFLNNVRYYHTKGEIDFGKRLVGNAEATFDESLKSSMEEIDWKKTFAKAYFSLIIFRILAGLLIIALLVWLLHGFFHKVGHTINENTPSSIGYGFLYFLIVPLIAVLGFLIVVGIPLSIFVLSVFGFTIATSHAITSVAASYWIQKRYKQDWTKFRIIAISLGLFVLLKLIMWIPFLGWAISIFAVAVAFGGIILTIMEMRSEKDLEMVE